MKLLSWLHRFNKHLKTPTATVAPKIRTNTMTLYSSRIGGHLALKTR